MKNFWSLIFVVFILLIAAMGLNYARDPLSFFHEATPEFVAHAHDRYSLAGKLKSSDYNALVIGSSHSVHFSDDILSHVSNDQWLNAAVAGSTAYEQYLAFSLAQKNKQLNTVIWELRLDAYIGEPTRTRLGSAFPIAYYKDNLRGNLEYLLSLDTLVAAIKSQSLPVKKDNKYRYGVTQVADVLKKYCDNLPLNGHRVGLKNKSYSLAKNIKQTLEKAVANAPDVKFKIFFPPYSILNHAYLNRFNEQEYKEYLMFRGMIVTQMSPYPNVEIYDFQGDESLITNIENYRDLRHYNANIYLYIAQSMAYPSRQDMLVESDFKRQISQIIKDFDFTPYKSCLTF